MEDNMKNEQWINEAMESLKGMQRIPATPHMYEGVMRRLADKRQQSSLSSSVILKRAAIAAILLLVINVASIIHFSHKTVAVQQQNVYQAVNEEIGYLSEDSF